MKYLLAFVRDREKMYDGSEEEMKAAMEAWNAFDQGGDRRRRADRQRGARAPGRPQRPYGSPPAADHAVTDGPFAETKEQLGGFCLIDCDSLDEAIGWAKKVPIAPDSAVEVRAGHGPLGHTAIDRREPGA